MALRAMRLLAVSWSPRNTTKSGRGRKGEGGGWREEGGYTHRWWMVQCSVWGGPGMVWPLLCHDVIRHNSFCYVSCMMYHVSCITFYEE